MLKIELGNMVRPAIVTIKFMKWMAHPLALVLALGLFPSAALGQAIVNFATPTPVAPPPPYRIDAFAQGRLADTRSHSSSALYSIGNPTDEEQLLLEFVNRARRDPAAEGLLLKNSTDSQILRFYGYFGVNLNAFASAMTAFPPAQPLAMNAQLTAAARVHSLDMFDNTYQEHTSIIDGTDPRDRVVAQGYPPNAAVIAENIYAAAQSVLHGHAGFEVDWGNDATSVDGMQNPPHHRITIHDPELREAGMGVVLGTKSALPGDDRQDVGPLVITQNFGEVQNADRNPFITGVAYYDFNSNGQYDLGEGLGGVSVTIDGIAMGALTADAGGYAVPVPARRSYNVTFSAAGLLSQTFNVNLETNNAKIDFAPPYVPPDP